MSQSPQTADLAATGELKNYRDAWSALSHLIGQGKSFSGNERNCFFLNTHDRKFAQADNVLGLDLADDSRAVAITDWNGDGAPDIWLTNRTAPRVKLLMNKIAPKNWFRLKLEGIESNRDAIGARVVVYTTAPELKIMRTVRAGDGFLSQSSKWLHFGLGDAKVDRVEVRWPSGKQQTITGYQSGQHYKLKEGSDLISRWAPPEVTFPPTRDFAIADAPATRTWIMGRVPLIENDFESRAASNVLMFDEPLLITLWSQTCQPCLTELAEWSKKEEQFRAAKCNVLALCVDDITKKASAEANGESSGDAYLDRIQWRFSRGKATPEFVEGLEILQRTLLEWQQPLPVPSSFLIDEDGRLAAIYRGVQDTDVILADIRRLSATPEEQRDAAVPFSGRWASKVFPSDALPVVKMLEMSGKHDLATEYLKNYTDVAPETERLSLIKAQRALVARLLPEERWSELTPSLRHLRKLAPDDAPLHRDLGNQLLQSGRGADALAHFELALALNENHAVLHYNAGLAAISTRKFGRAAELLGRVVELNPDDLNAHYHLGNAFQFSGDAKKAVKHYSTAHQLKPTWAVPANNAAWILATTSDDSVRDGNRALQLIEPFCSDWQNAKPAIAPLLGTYVAALAESGDFETALSVNRHLITIATDEKQRSKLQQRQETLTRRKAIRD